MSKHNRIEKAMTCEEQVRLWAKGLSVHNTTRDECCPDFSCCNPNIHTPQAVRRRFRDGDRKTRAKLLVGFLAGLLKGEGFDVCTSADIR